MSDSDLERLAKKKRSAKKRDRQSKKRRIRNRIVKSEVKTEMKKLKNLPIETPKDEFTSKLRFVVSKLDKSSKKNVYHKKNIARKKSRLIAFLRKKGFEI